MSAIIPAIRPAVQEAISSALLAGQDLVLGPELLVNGDFSNGGMGWSVNNADATHIATFAGGTLRYQSGTTSPQLNVQQPGILTVGKTYQVVVEISASTSGVVKTDMSTPATTIAATPGTFIYRVVAAATNFNLTRSTANVDMAFERVSVREILST